MEVPKDKLEQKLKSLIEMLEMLSECNIHDYKLTIDVEVSNSEDSIEFFQVRSYMDDEVGRCFRIQHCSNINAGYLEDLREDEVKFELDTYDLNEIIEENLDRITNVKLSMYMGNKKTKLVQFGVVDF